MRNIDNNRRMFLYALIALLIVLAIWFIWSKNNINQVPVAVNNGPTEQTTQQGAITLNGGNTENEGSNAVSGESTVIVNPTDNSVSASDLSDITVEFVDVGQGDCSFIVTANNDVIMIDTGKSKGADDILEELEKYEFEDIDLLILTHPDSDHISGTEKILENYQVNEVLMSSFVKDTKLFTSMLTAFDEQDINVTQATLGQTYDIDGVHILVVGVDSVYNSKGELSTANNSSVVCKVSYGDVDILYSGDAETEAERVILSNGFDLDSEIYKAGHHGSDTSSTEEYVKAISPEIVIVSCGVGNKYGHPKQVTIDLFERLGIKVYRTDLLGDVIFTVNGEGYTEKK